MLRRTRIRRPLLLTFRRPRAERPREPRAQRFEVVPAGKGEAVGTFAHGLQALDGKLLPGGARAAVRRVAEADPASGRDGGAS